MQWNKCLIRYGELSLKGRNRKSFVRKLVVQLKRVLKDLPTIRIIAERDRMFLEADSAHDIDIAMQRLPEVFGIQSFSPVAKSEPTIEAILEKALEVMGTESLEGKSFKVEIKRGDKSFPYVTAELQQMIGGHVLRAFPELRVQMKNPDIMLHVDIRKEGAFFTNKVIKGAGGMPVGSNGHTLVMMSGGIDSPVAGYMMMKRGVSFDAIHFASPPFTSEQATQKVKDLTAQLTKYGGSIRLHIIPFTELQQLVVQQVPNNLMMTTTRRMMLQVAEGVREEIGAMAIVTGESLGQVASQTLESLTAINSVTSTPVLRPLIAMDKLEIIEIAQKIGTYEVSIQPYEDCCTIFTPSNPKTKPRLEKVEHFESFTNFEPFIRAAVANRTTIEITGKQEQAFAHLL